jgi:cytochrome P450
MLKAMRSPPGPSLLRTITLGPRLRRDPLGTIERLARTYGDLVCFRVGPLRAFLVYQPAHLERVLHANHRNYRKGAFVDRTRVLVGDGLFSSEGEPWLRQRRLLQPAFHRERIGALVGEIVSAVGRTLDRWTSWGERGEPFDLAAEMHRMTLDAVGRTLFGVDLDATEPGVGQAMVEALRLVSERAMGLVAAPLAVPTRRNRRLRRAVAVLDGFVGRIVSARRAGGAAGSDLLSILLEARDEESGRRLTDRQLRDEVLTFVLAGHETTALALTWAWHLLMQNPAAEERVRAEVAATLGTGPPGLGHVPALGYLRMVLEEAMRLYPPLWAFPRQAIAEDRLGTHRVPPRAVLALVPWVTHRLPKVWDDPERFDPERFAPEHVRARSRFAHVPFGGGPRVCIGSELAMLEAAITLAMTAQRYRLRPVPGRTVVPEARTTLAPRGGLWVTVEQV